MDEMVKLKYRKCICNLTLRKDYCFTIIVDTRVHYEAGEKKLHKLIASVPNLNSCTKRVSIIWPELTCKYRYHLEQNRVPNSTISH